MIHNRKLRILKYALFVPVFLAAFSFVTMLLWNSLVPVLFKGPEITFLQSVGLIVLSKILFGGFSKHHAHTHWRNHEAWRKRMNEKWEKMTPEEKEQWKNRCGHWRWTPPEETDKTKAAETPK